MAQDFVSSTTQSIGNPGWLTLLWTASGGTGSTVSVSFSPVFAHSLQYQLSPIQKVNVAVTGGLHIFQLGTQEIFNLPIEFTNLPWDDNDPAPNAGQGFASLMSYIRYVLNYHQYTCLLTTPDGIQEQVRYLGGLDAFREASGQAQKHNRWDGTVLFTRVIP